MKSKILGYLVELIIVILGVSIAFWLSQLAEDKKENKVLLSYYEQLRSDIKNDIKQLDFVLADNKARQDKLINALRFYEDPDKFRDSILNYGLNLGNYSFFKPMDFTYQSMITSGDLKLVKNQLIKKRLIQLYSIYKNIDQLQINYADAMDKYFPVLIRSVDMLTGVTSPGFHKELVVKNTHAYVISDLGSHLRAYDRAKKNAQELDSLIRLDLK